MTAEQQHTINSGFGAKTEPWEALAGIDLAGKVALVTGGYSGIGLETTRYRAVESWAVDEQEALRLWELSERMVADEPV